MRIGIDGGCLANRRGFGRFARRTLEALAESATSHEFAVLVDRPSLDSVRIPAAFETIAVEVGRAPSEAASSTGRRSLADIWSMSRAASRAGLDLLYYPATYSYFPARRVGRVVVTMHDTLALARPDWVFPTWQGRIAWKAKEHLAAAQADRILTVSEAARRDLLAWFRLPEDRVGVVTEGAEPAFRPTPEGPESDEVLRRFGIAPGSCYLLYVGGLSPHKNLPRLIEAFARLPRDDVRLVLVGDLGDVFHTHVPELRAKVAEHSLGDRVLFTGFVPDALLVYLYGRAYTLVQPSLMEGFGLPPVEAMACGTPVAYSHAGSLPEVVGDAGVAFDPTDVGRISETIAALLADPSERGRLAGVALARSARFTRAETARGLLACFDELATQRAGLRGWRR